VSTDPEPWYRRIYRWGQTNLTEVDPSRYDAAWWREHWRKTHVQGVIVNAGGIVAYYPSRYTLHHRALTLGERDFYGEIVAAAREQGLAVLARMDSNRASAAFFVEHPDWFSVDVEGRPYRAEDRYVACVNSPYYEQFLPDVLREIVERSHPDGITDNSWSGLERTRICHCGHCARGFREATGLNLPRAIDWDDAAYRRWIVWNYTRRIEIWEMNNRITREAGGPHCVWIGMNSGDLVAQSMRFRDYKAICERAEIIMLDSQARTASGGFQANAETGKLIHGLLGWDRLVPESMAMYQAGRPTFRIASKPEPEARLWAVEGFAGTIQPWW
jgi:putative glycosyl hydrolase-like family 6 (GHL6) protein